MHDFDPKTIRPLWNRVLIEEDEKPTVSAGGIVLPATAKDAQYCTPATVLAVGRGKRLDNGMVIEPELAKGDRIILGKAHGTLIQGQRIRIIDADVIEAVFEREGP